MIALTHAFGLSCEPFTQDISTDKLFPLPGLKAPQTVCTHLSISS
jgi:hypothetical protein